MNGHAAIDTTEATEHLKNILNVGKNESSSTAPKLNSATMSNSEASSEGNLMNETYQTIDLSQDKDGDNVSIYGSDVSIYSSALIKETKCGQVIIDNMVDFGWEEKYYPGRLISIHPNGNYLAYVLRRSSNKNGGYVRVLKTKTEIRHLIKDYRSDVKDIAFAHSISQILLGSVDARGELLIHKIVEENNELLSQLLIRVTRPAMTKISDNHRIIWCPYIPDDNDNVDDSNETSPEDVLSLLVVTHDEKAEIWNIDTILKEHGVGEVSTNEISNGLQLISEHKLPISTATFSPDGTALSIASLDGDVKFFQVGSLGKDVSPRCLHKWTPHKGKPLSSLFFLDNHKNPKTDVQFWKFAITGADNNRELKLWSCETWICLQTLRIYPNVADDVLPCLKAELDLSSKYLFLSDINRKVLHVLLLHQDPLTSRALVCSLSEFAVPYPVLSLAIVNVKGQKSLLDDEEEVEKEDIDDQDLNDDFNKQSYLVKLFWIHTRSLQFCRINYKPKLQSPLHSVDSMSNLSQESFVFKDGLSDISMDIRDSRGASDMELSMEKDLCRDGNITPQQIPMTSIPSHLSNFTGCGDVLLTPEDFTSPSHSNLSQPSVVEDSLYASHHEPIRVCDPVSSLVDDIDSLPVEPNGLVRRKSSQHSANSSPSREVAEILAPNQQDKINNIPEPNLKVDVESMKNDLNSFVKSAAQIRKQPEYHLNDWPQAPDPNKEYRMAASNSRQSTSVGDGPSIAFDTNAHSVLIKLSHSLDDLTGKVISLTDVLRDQRHEIQTLQDDIRVLRQDQTLIHSNVHDITAMETSFTKTVEQAFVQHMLPEYTRLEGIIAKHNKESQQMVENRMAAVSQKVSSSFEGKLEKTLKHEIINSVLPQMSTTFDTLVKQLQLDIVQRLGNIDISVKDGLSKHFKGKPFNDALTQSLTITVQHQVQSACKSIFENSVVPSFEKSCSQLFQQLSEAFKAGTLEYIQYLEKHSQAVCSNMDVTVASIREETKKLTSSTKTFENEKKNMKEEISQLLFRQNEILLSSVREVVRDEMQKMIREQNVQAMNSRAVTPVPQAHPQVQKSQLLQLVKQGQINDAFQQALSAMDVQLVLFLCESVNVEQVFGPSNGSPLKQTILLSLLSQLSADLTHKTDVRVRYIEEVIASLDSTCPEIQEHIRNVLHSLQQKISLFLQKNPTHKLCRNLKRISMAIQSLIYMCN